MASLTTISIQTCLSGVNPVVVTHLYPRCDQEKVVETIRANVGVEVIEAQDLLEIEI